MEKQRCGSLFDVESKYRLNFIYEAQNFQAMKPNDLHGVWRVSRWFLIVHLESREFREAM